jgi:lysophospholipase L1-like esterase
MDGRSLTRPDSEQTIDKTPLSLRARLVVIAGVLIFIASAFALAIWVGGRKANEKRPEVYDPAGDHPGDLMANLDISDDVQYYGLQQNLKYRIRTNSLGFRGPEPEKNGSPVVLVLGDSFAFGMGVQNGHTFTDSLLTVLKKTYPNVVVHNAAVPGYTIVDQLEQWREKLRQLKPDLVLVGHTASDIKEMHRPTSFRRFIKHDEKDSNRHDPMVSRAIAATQGNKRKAAMTYYVYTEKQLVRRLAGEATAKISEFMRDYQKQLALLASEVVQAKSGAHFGLVLWVQEYGIGDIKTEQLKGFSKSKNIAIFDADTAMRRQQDIPRDRLFLPDQHFSALGNEMMARFVADWIQSGALLAPPTTP